MSSVPYGHVPLEFELIRAVVLVTLAAFAIFVALSALIDLAARRRPDRMRNGRSALRNRAL